MSGILREREKIVRIIFGEKNCERIKILEKKETREKIYI